MKEGESVAAAVMEIVFMQAVVVVEVALVVAVVVAVVVGVVAVQL